MSAISDNKWEISSKTSYWGLGRNELWGYRHMVGNLVKRNFLLNYQQTVLGPLWILLQPLLTLAIYMLVFGKMVKLSTGTVPPILFYFSGIVVWNLFSDTFGGTSNTFRDNIQLFSKVYFPRIIMPASVVCTHFLRFSIQLLLLLLLIGYYWAFQGLVISPAIWLFALPVIILSVMLIGLGLGLIFSVFTAKYRDISNLVAVGLRLLMFITPVLYPLSTVPEKARWLAQANPLTPLFEAFRLGLLGEGTVSITALLYCFLFMFVVLIAGLVTFNKQGEKLIDVV